MDLMEAKYKDIRQRLFAIQLALDKKRTRAIQNRTKTKRRKIK